MTLYQKLIERKRTWTPVQMEAGKLKEGAEEMIFRALALRHLEIPVGEFISAGLKGCLLYTSPSPRDRQKSRMPSSA